MQSGRTGCDSVKVWTGNKLSQKHIMYQFLWSGVNHTHWVSKPECVSELPSGDVQELHQSRW